MPKHTSHKRGKHSHTRVLAWSGIAAALVMVLMLAADRPTYQGATSSYSVCVGVTVIGLDGGDPGTSYCDAPGPATSSSSSSSSEPPSSASSESSTASFAQASTRSRTWEEVNNGGRRYSIEESQSSIGRLIKEWRRRYGLHGAASSAPARLFPDVPVDSWFAGAAYNFAARAIVDINQPFFRPADGATRAETAKLLVLIHGGNISHIPDVPSFDDAPKNSWFYRFVEHAAFQGWMKGYGNCYLLRPCFTRPAEIVTRAEAAALIVRSFRLERDYSSPWIDDVSDDSAWYINAVHTAADHCILRGDAGTNDIRPNDPVSRAELVTMLHRAEQDLQYGIDCVRGESVLKRAAPSINAPVSTSAKLDSDGSPAVSPSDDVCLKGAWSCLSEAAVGDAVSVCKKVLQFILFGLPR